MLPAHTLVTDFFFMIQSAGYWARWCILKDLRINKNLLAFVISLKLHKNVKGNSLQLSCIENSNICQQPDSDATETASLYTGPYLNISGDLQEHTDIRSNDIVAGGQLHMTIWHTWVKLISAVVHNNISEVRTQQHQ